VLRSLAGLPFGGVLALPADPETSGAKRRDEAREADEDAVSDEQNKHKKRCRPPQGQGQRAPRPPKALSGAPRRAYQEVQARFNSHDLRRQMRHRQEQLQNDR
jgi:hypothetical protein